MTNRNESYEARVAALEAQGMSRSDAQSIVDMEPELIHSYTRKQAIEDGVLVDVSAAAFGAGFKVHVAMTATAHADVDRMGDPMKTASERLFAFLRALKTEIRDQNERHGAALGHEFQWVYRNRVRLKAHMGPGDSWEPVLTLMLSHED
jgi:hypothetical protein